MQLSKVVSSIKHSIIGGMSPEAIAFEQQAERELETEKFLNGLTFDAMINEAIEVCNRIEARAAIQPAKEIIRGQEW